LVFVVVELNIDRNLRVSKRCLWLALLTNNASSLAQVAAHFAKNKMTIWLSEH